MQPVRRVYNRVSWTVLKYSSSSYNKWWPRGPNIFHKRIIAATTVVVLPERQLLKTVCQGRYLVYTWLLLELIERVKEMRAQFLYRGLRQHHRPIISVASCFLYLLAFLKAITNITIKTMACQAYSLNLAFRHFIVWLRGNNDVLLFSSFNMLLQ